MLNDIFNIKVIHENLVNYPALPEPMSCDGHIWVPFIKEFVHGYPENASTYLKVFCYKCQSLGEITGVKHD